MNHIVVMRQNIDNSSQKVGIKKQWADQPRGPTVEPSVSAITTIICLVPVHSKHIGKQVFSE